MEFSYNSIVKEKAKFDVLVCGGGCAGVVAAVAAARGGASVGLLEKHSVVGGTSTVGLVGPFMTCYNAKGDKQVIKGIFDELVLRMEAKGGAIHPSKTGKVSKYGCYIKHRHNNVTPFHPEILKMVMTEMLLEAGVKLFLNVSIVDAIVELNKISGAICFDGESLKAFYGKVIIDATGDAFLSLKAGVKCFLGTKEDKKDVQPMTLFFWIYGADDDKIEKYLDSNPELKYLPYNQIIENDRKDGNFPVSRNKIGLYHMGESGEWRLNTTRLQNYNPVSPDDLTEAYVDGLSQVEFLMNFFKKCPGLENARLAASGSMMGIRESRLIEGEYTLKVEDMISPTIFADSIALCSYPVDIHPSKGFMPGFNDKTKIELADVYEIPYGVLVPKKIDGLLVAGRCVSASKEAMAAIRVIPPVFAMAEAAGLAAALCVKEDVMPRNLNTDLLRSKLKENGAIVSIEDLNA